MTNVSSTVLALVALVALWCLITGRRQTRTSGTPLPNDDGALAAVLFDAEREPIDARHVFETVKSARSA